MDKFWEVESQFYIIDATGLHFFLKKNPASGKSLLVPFRCIGGRFHPTPAWCKDVHLSILNRGHENNAESSICLVLRFHCQTVGSFPSIIYLGSASFQVRPSVTYFWCSLIREHQAVGSKRRFLARGPTGCKKLMTSLRGGSTEDNPDVNFWIKQAKA